MEVYAYTSIKLKERLYFYLDIEFNVIVIEKIYCCFYVSSKIEFQLRVNIRDKIKAGNVCMNDLIQYFNCQYSLEMPNVSALWLLLP